MIRVNELDLSFLNLIHFRSGKRDMPAVQHEEVNLPVIVIPLLVTVHVQSARFASSLHRRASLAASSMVAGDAPAG